METPTIEVGILSAETICFKLSGTFFLTDAGTSVSNKEGFATITGETSFIINIDEKELAYNGAVILDPSNENTDAFELFNVIIGVQFHWERAENQRFRGKLKIFADRGKLTAVNILSLEEYLLSVISSEMSSTSAAELLKAHAVISRSWLLAQLEKSKQVKSAGYMPFIKNEDGYIRWYDREDHDRFDVCADDHCQRYQGITKVSSEKVYDALQTTRGEVLTYNNKVCDARFYKCCGGVTELFEHVWEPVHHPYLAKVIDNPTAPAGYNMDLSIEENAAKWIRTKPEAFCNTDDKEVLSQMLNNYDQETPDFYRWETTLTQTEVKELLSKKVNIDVGDVLDLIPVERGVSGRIIRLKIVGSKNSLTIGKELEIRKALSKSHLYSSAFVVEKKSPKDKGNKTPESFVLKGAGWGHGVGLCQIGAAVMSTKGYSYQEILSHYFPSSKLERIY
ncbi:MAG: SpoIID/LytB domain-containing protein [Paludibacter sp.]|nr:SpoIID/LytB domain-containing protein [Paludibacter sp.]MDD4198113.1 SpoIID/LytB domain-containing protein [Paludibacter sp.]MDD4427391.1 SpoIID/LytB domain-containing protein [Paludibacter sp.]